MIWQQSIENTGSRSITGGAMNADGLYRLEDDLAEGALDSWIETVIAEIEAYLVAVTRRDPDPDLTT